MVVYVYVGTGFEVDIIDEGKQDLLRTKSKVESIVEHTFFFFQEEFRDSDPIQGSDPWRSGRNCIKRYI